MNINVIYYIYNYKIKFKLEKYVTYFISNYRN